MRITKKELLKKINWDPLKHDYPDMDRWGITIMERTARALGYEVVEEPELPERLAVGKADLVPFGGTTVAEIVAPNFTLFLSYRKPEHLAVMAAELVRRYNAKTAVLKVVKRIENAVAVWENQLPHAPGVAKDLREYARLFRSAYEAGDE